MDGSIFEVEVLDGQVSTDAQLDGQLSETGVVAGRLETPKVIDISDYNKLKNKPQIENQELSGNRTLDEFGVSPISVDDILNILT